MRVLFEALIQVPPRMLQKALETIEYRALWILRDRMRGKSKYFPQHVAAYKAYVKKRGYKFPRHAFDLKKGYSAFEAPIDLSGMKPHYAKLTPDRDKTALVVDWTGVTGDTKALAGWLNKTKTGGSMLIVYMCNNEIFKRYPHCHPDDVEHMVSDMRESLEHEMRHMIQSVLIRHPDQLKRHPDYKEHKGGYFASPIEFDPQIGSAVDTFLSLLKVIKASKAKPNLRQWVIDYTAANPRKKFMGYEAFGPSPLFKHLRRRSPKRWQQAVRKFVIELRRRLPELGGEERV